MDQPAPLSPATPVGSAPQQPHSPHVVENTIPTPPSTQTTPQKPPLAAPQPPTPAPKPLSSTKPSPATPTQVHPKPVTGQSAPNPTTPPPTNSTPPTSPSTPLVAATLVAILTFGFGLTGSIGYYRYFNDSHPLPPSSFDGELLGATTESVPATPSATPTPDLALKPEVVDQPLDGTLAYIQDNQIYTVKADRTSPDQITTDESQKTDLAVSPDGLSLAYVFTPSPDSDTPENATGIALVNRQTKEVTELVKPDKFTLSNPDFSPDGQYLSYWVNHGLEVTAVDLKTQKTTLSYSSPESDLVTPIVWVPLTQKASFILSGELFTVDANDQNLQSLALDVISTTDHSDHPQILPPVWSGSGRYVAFHRSTGLYIYDSDTKQEIPIQTLAKAEPDQPLPWQALAFNNPTTHLLYLNRQGEDNQTTYLYSLLEAKNVPLSDLGLTAMINPATDSIIGFPPQDSGEDTLESYSLTKWDLNSCPASDFRYNTPPSSNSFNSSGTGLIGLGKNTSQITTLKLMNLENCSVYDLVKADQLSYPLWLPN